MTTYEKFLEDYKNDLQIACKQLKAVAVGMNHEANMKALDRIEKTYDKAVCRFIDGMIGYSKCAINPDQIASIALDNMNNKGTEMRMILLAIEEVYLSFCKSTKTNPTIIQE